MGLLSRLMREGCQRKISIYLGFVVARRGWVGVGAGVVILVVCEELASVLLLVFF